MIIDFASGFSSEELRNAGFSNRCLRKAALAIAEQALPDPNTVEEKSKFVKIECKIIVIGIRINIRCE